MKPIKIITLSVATLGAGVLVTSALAKKLRPKMECDICNNAVPQSQCWTLTGQDPENEHATIVCEDCLQSAQPCDVARFKESMDHLIEEAEQAYHAGCPMTCPCHPQVDEDDV